MGNICPANHHGHHKGLSTDGVATTTGSTGPGGKRSHVYKIEKGGLENTMGGNGVVVAPTNGHHYPLIGMGNGANGSTTFINGISNGQYLNSPFPSEVYVL